MNVTTWIGKMASKNVCTVLVGDRVRHSNTRQWGRILEIIPQHDGSAELKVEYQHTPGAYNFEGQGFWATYHIDRHESAKESA